jgi:hypothetical protein
VTNYLGLELPVNAKSIVPDSSIILIKATEEQLTIGWGHWLKEEFQENGLH